MKSLNSLLKVRHELADTPLLKKGLEEAEQHLVSVSEWANKYPSNVNANAKAADVGCISLAIAMSKFKSSFLDLALLTVALSALIVSIGFVYPNIVTIFSLSAVWFTMMYMMYTIVSERAISLGAHNYIGRMLVVNREFAKWVAGKFGDDVLVEHTKHISNTTKNT